MDKEKETIKTLSDRIVSAQKPIRILDAIKWDESIKQDFFDHQCKKLPKVTQEYYQNQPLPFNPDEKMEEFRAIIRDIKNHLGQFHGLGKIMTEMCQEYITACEMLKARGTQTFSELSVDLYGSPDDRFYPNGPKLSELANLLRESLVELKALTRTTFDEKRYTAEQAVTRLQKKLSNYFIGDNQVKVMLSDDIIADAAAGADTIKLNKNVKFSDREIRYLEVHEGWVHVGTTVNGSLQPVATFLSKGSPSSSVTQEGLAITTEIFTFSSNPQRMQKIIGRLAASEMANNGANFIEVYQSFIEHGWTEAESYNYAMRVFRGSLPDGKPFTKDISYTKGFLLIYNYIRLATHKGLLKLIPTMFIGKTLLKDLPVLTEYIEHGIIIPPKFIPPQFADLSALSAWMSFSLFLNKLDLEKIAINYQDILR